MVFSHTNVAFIEKCKVRCIHYHKSGIYRVHAFLLPVMIIAKGHILVCVVLVCLNVCVCVCVLWRGVGNFVTGSQHCLAQCNITLCYDFIFSTLFLLGNVKSQVFSLILFNGDVSKLLSCQICKLVLLSVLLWLIATSQSANQIVPHGSSW